MDSDQLDRIQIKNLIALSAESSKQNDISDDLKIGGYLLIIVAVIGAIIFGMIMTEQQYRWESWPTTDGTILTVDTWVGSGYPDIPEVGATVKFSYQVKGSTYEGKISRGVESCFYTQCKKRKAGVAAEVRKRAIIVHYDPRNPAKNHARYR